MEENEERMRRLEECARLVLAMGKLDLSDSLSLVVINIHLGAACALAKLGLGKED